VGGIGTLINVLGVLLGGGAGIFMRRGISQSLRSQLIRVQGLSVVILGLSGVLSRLGSSEGDVLMMLITMVLGTLLGAYMGIEEAIEGFGERLEARYGGGEEGFVQGFLIASMTMCIGAMGIIGAFEDALFGNISILLAKTVLDSFTAFILANYYGRGVLFSALPLGLWQGSFTLLAGFLAPFLTDSVLHNTSIVGNVMIFAIGLNLLLDSKLSVANMLPALFLAAMAGFL
jgi:uncharacterized membrane protein YqgA involved in biofilm formation